MSVDQILDSIRKIMRDVPSQEKQPSASEAMELNPVMQTPQTKAPAGVPGKEPPKALDDKVTLFVEEIVREQVDKILSDWDEKRLKALVEKVFAEKLNAVFKGYQEKG